MRYRRWSVDHEVYCVWLQLLLRDTWQRGRGYMIPAVVPPVARRSWPTLSGFECSSITEGSDLSEAKLVELNPWIGTGDCSTGLFAGLKGEEQRAVCLGTGPLSSSTTTSPTRATSPVTPTIGTSTSLAPSATVTPQPGAIKTCNAYHVVKSGDECATIAEANGISLETFYKWNPQVGSDCRTLWLGYGVCVSVSS